MFNANLAQDYIRRCDSRLKAIDVLFAEHNWPDVVGESQEVVELALKAMLRNYNVDFPRIHDVSAVISSEKAKLPEKLHKDLDFFCQTSRSLRRDRELAFYGGEDLTPLEFYSEADAKKALLDAKMVVQKIVPFIRKSTVSPD